MYSWQLPVLFVFRAYSSTFSPSKEEHTCRFYFNSKNRERKFSRNRKPSRPLIVCLYKTVRKVLRRALYGAVYLPHDTLSLWRLSDTGNSPERQGTWNQLTETHLARPRSHELVNNKPTYVTTCIPQGQKVHLLIPFYSILSHLVPLCFHLLRNRREVVPCRALAWLEAKAN